MTTLRECNTPKSRNSARTLQELSILSTHKRGLLHARRTLNMAPSRLQSISILLPGPPPLQNVQFASFFFASHLLFLFALQFIFTLICSHIVSCFLPQHQPENKNANVRRTEDGLPFLHSFSALHARPCASHFRWGRDQPRAYCLLVAAMSLYSVAVQR